jgi:signal transduction histidine kinase
MAVLKVGPKATEHLGRGPAPPVTEREPVRPWRGLGLRAREVLVVSLLTFLVVATTTLLNISYLTRRTLEETYRHGELLTRQIYGLSARTLLRGSEVDPARALAEDRELRDFLNLAVQYSPQVLYIAITDPSGRAILHTDPQKQGHALPARPAWNVLLSHNAFRRIGALYGGDQIYEIILPLSLDRQPFGAIRLGIPLSLVKGELHEALVQSALFGGVALMGALVVAFGLSSLTLKPIRSLARDMERLRRGELDFGSSENATDEFGEIAFHLQRLGQEMRADRTQVKAQHARYQHVVDHLEDGLVFLDVDQRVQFANRAAGLILGPSVAGANGIALGEALGPAHPVLRLVQQALGESANLQSISVKIPTEGGGTIDCMISVFPVEASDHVREGVLVLMKDLRALTVSARTLRSLIRYSAQVAELGKATSEVTHEVKNPLNAMAIHLRLLKDRLGEVPDPVKQSLDVIQKQIGRLDSVVQNFMHSIRPQNLELGAVDVVAIVTEICSLLEAEWRDKGVSFVTRAAADLPSVQGNGDALRTAFMNIILNACQAMPTGGVVTATVERPQEDVLAVAISDTGTGIKPEDMDQIFRMSFTTKAEGSGIGLTLVRRIVEMHDGDIEVSSRVGQGTTIVVRLPIR